MLSSNNVGKDFYVHRLVAMAFCKGYKPVLTVNHKDENKDNNCYLNLEWLTTEDNVRYYFMRRRMEKLAAQNKE